MTALDLSAYVGLAAVALATLNICLGLLMAVRYSPLRHWPHRHINLFALHNWTAYLAISLTLLHPVFLLFAKTVSFSVFDVLVPISSPQQPVINTLGAIALYGLMVVVVTSYIRLRLGRRLWKLIHFLVYGVAGFGLAHALFTDPHVANQPIDWFDGEKVLVEACAFIVIVGSAWALFYRRKKDARERTLHVGRYAEHAVLGTRPVTAD